MTESEGDEPDVIEPVTRANLSGDVWRRKKMQRIEFVQPGELRDRIIASVLSGKKTATSRLAAIFDLEQKEISKPGDRYEVVDSNGSVAGIIEIDEVRIMPLADVGEDVSSAEGGFFEGIEDWRRVHVQGWQSYAAAIQGATSDPNWSITDDTPVVVRFFHLVE
ncbi:ASCH domain-containing protein [Pseudarthrobacter siccitolerans]|nr:ASCH domain-containing protein [Pseudarthrobacter siccitolerans]